MWDDANWQDAQWDDSSWKNSAGESTSWNAQGSQPAPASNANASMGFGTSMNTAPGAGAAQQGGWSSGWGDTSWNDTSWNVSADMGSSAARTEKKEKMHSSVLLVGARMNYLMTSLKERLMETTMEVNVCVGDIDNLSKMAEEKTLHGIIIYAEQDLIKDAQVLIFIKDLVVEKEIPIFAIGSMEELDVVRSMIPAHLIREIFERPINVREVAERIENYVSASARVEKKKILVIDDSSVMLHSLKEWLGEKYQIVMADSGMAGITSMTKMKPDLILLDYEMPIVDGKQVLQMIRSQIEFADIPVMFLTGRGDRESVLEVMTLKPAGYLLKSMKPYEIIQAVDDFFARQKNF